MCEIFVLPCRGLSPPLHNLGLAPGRTSRDVRQHMNLSKRRKTICHISGMEPYGMLVA